MPLTGKEMLRLFKQQGWVLDRVRGSHHIMVHPRSGDTVPIPVHGSAALKRGLEHALLKRLELNR